MEGVLCDGVSVTAESQRAPFNCLLCASTSGYSMNLGFEKSMFLILLTSYKCSLKVLFPEGILEFSGLVFIKMMFIQ